MIRILGIGAFCFLTSVFAIAQVPSWMQKKAEGCLLDKRDYKEYKTIKLGAQTWMAENLAFAGKASAISNVDDGFWAYDLKREHLGKYGYLYTLEQALNACPVGWHLPSDKEWDLLERELGFVHNVETIEGKGRNRQIIMSFFLGNHGFNALMGGFKRNGYNGFEQLDRKAFFWTSSTVNSKEIKEMHPTPQPKVDYWIRALRIDGPAYGRMLFNKDFGFSVRCVQNKQEDGKKKDSHHR